MFVSLQCIHESSLGFLFKSDKICRKFCYALAGVHTELTVSASKLSALKNPDQEYRRILKRGLELTAGLEDPEMINAIEDIFNKFDLKDLEAQDEQVF